MSRIAIPRSLEDSYKKLTSNKTCLNKLNHFLRTEHFSSALIAHRKGFVNVSDHEYRMTLEVMLEFYQPGQSVGINELATSSIEKLQGLLEDRQISRNEIRQSFVGLLLETGIITGQKTYVWAWLNTPSLSEKVEAKARNIYTAYIAQTDAEANLKRAYREATALRKMERVVLDNRSLLDDINHNLEVIKKMDARCRDRAMELGIPYSQVKEEAMKTRKNTGVNIKPLYFPILVGAVILVSALLSTDNNAVTNDQDASLGQMLSIETVAQPKYGLSIGEDIWRSRYIELHKQYGTAKNSEMEAAMFALAAEYMIPMTRMSEIVATIKPEEVQP